MNLKGVFLALIFLNCISLIFFLNQVSNSNSITPEKNSNSNFLQTIRNERNENYQFKDRVLANEILKQLDVFEPVSDKFFDGIEFQTNQYNNTLYGLIRDDYYCQKSRTHFIYNPDSLFYQQNFVTDYNSDGLLRSVLMPKVGIDLMPMINQDSLSGKTTHERIFEIKPEVNSFFFNVALHLYQHVGLNFACLNQQYNHIPGHGSLNRKDKVAEALVEYGKRYKDRSTCFGHDKFFPQTWILYDRQQCKDFFDNFFNTDEYQQLKEKHKIIFVRKRGFGVHKAKGVDPVHTKVELDVRENYRNGTLCGMVFNNFLMQRFIYDPLLLEGHKFDFRIYMLVASTNPLILYYHDGFLRVSLLKYDPNSLDKSVLLTNTDLAEQIFEEAAKGKLIDGMSEEELRNFQMWNLTKLQNYLIKVGKVSDENWLDNYLRPQFKKAMVHLLRATSSSFLKRSSLMEIFGVDFMLDENLNLWFLECNTSPVFKGTSEEKEKFLMKMLMDMFEISYGLLRSRMKRVVEFVNKITDEIQGVNRYQVKVPNLNQRLEEFKQITKNYFEPEYEPSSNNGFSKIIDENLDGIEKYSNLLSSECL